MGVAAHYTGVDIDPSAEIVADLGDRLPFDDDFAQVVVALDVLEHTDDIHHSFAELCRVASEHVVIALPNVYVIECRIAGDGASGCRSTGSRSTSPTTTSLVLLLRHGADRGPEQAARSGWRVMDERACSAPRAVRRTGWAAKRWPNCSRRPTRLARTARARRRRADPTIAGPVGRRVRHHRWTAAADGYQAWLRRPWRGSRTVWSTSSTTVRDTVRIGFLPRSGDAGIVHFEPTPAKEDVVIVPPSWAGRGRR